MINKFITGILVLIMGVSCETEIVANEPEFIDITEYVIQEVQDSLDTYKQDGNEPVLIVVDEKDPSTELADLASQIESDDFNIREIQTIFRTFNIETAEIVLADFDVKEDDSDVDNNEENSKKNNEEVLENTVDTSKETKNEQVNETETPKTQRQISDSDANMLLKIAMAEAEGEDVEGKALVMLVVLNRVASSKFPNSVSKVINQKNQFTPVANGRYDKVKPNSDCYTALEMVRNGWDESQGALYFESQGGSSWHRRNLQYLFQHGKHYFYK